MKGNSSAREKSNKNVNVGALMSQDVHTCHPLDSLHFAARLMWDHDCGSVPVVDQNLVVGMLTDRDICMAAYTQGRSLHHLTVRDAMSRQVHSCHADDALSTAGQIMAVHQVRRLPVIEEDGRLVGIISLSDLARECARSSKQSKNDVTNAKIGETLMAICVSTPQATNAPAA